MSVHQAVTTVGLSLLFVGALAAAVERPALADPAWGEGRSRWVLLDGSSLAWSADDEITTGDLAQLGLGQIDTDAYSTFRLPDPLEFAVTYENGEPRIQGFAVSATQDIHFQASGRFNDADQGLKGDVSIVFKF